MNILQMKGNESISEYFFLWILIVFQFLRLRSRGGRNFYCIIRTMVGVRRNAKKLLVKNPHLVNLFSTLNNNDIRYGLYAGSHVSLFTSNRVPTDIDIMVADEDLENVKNLFQIERILGGKEVTKEITTDGVSLYLYGNQVEFVANLSIIVNEKEYPIHLTKLVWSNVTSVKANGVVIKMLPPEDTVIIKAPLQRGRDYGKHDLEDIEALLKVVKIDKVYLNKRLAEVKADKRATEVLEKYDLL